ncbi:MAG: hypothetical protein PHQ34_08650 [Methanothrix sp.]|nr:hypothetical protein [Methanothrix sp.]
MASHPGAGVAAPVRTLPSSSNDIKLLLDFPPIPRNAANPASSRQPISGQASRKPDSCAKELAAKRDESPKARRIAKRDPAESICKKFSRRFG